MAMVWTTPSGAFAAHNPPAWLRHDMQVAETQLPGMQVFVAFLSDLPGWDELKRHREYRNTFYPDEETRQAALARLTPGAQFKIYPQRRQKMASLCAQAFGPLEAFTAIANDVGNKFYPGTMADVPMQVQLQPSQLLGCDEQWLLHKEFPSQAVILLDERSLTAKQQLAHELGLSEWMCDVPNAVNLHRGEFWHEIQHQRAKYVTDAIASRRTEELGCDKHSVSMCMQLGDTATADYQLGLRTLTNFVTGVGTSPYWYPLRLTGHVVDEQRELQALINVKAQAANMQGAAVPEVLAMYERDAGISSDKRLRDLQGSAKLIAEPLSQQVAAQTLAMARRYTPGALKREIKFG